MSENLSQCNMILNLLQSGGSLTSYEAYTKLNITQLGARIKELESRGYVIGRTWETSNNKRYKRYFLG
ncbi:helix-turn-helix domain-containing protein [Neisseria dentiae]|nr:helix-turn-helix domain-containing protein [Neisseria dentiae]STZ49886.1 putative phage associated protein [Neisseria dentiae]STZ49930.1 putative phage associated protein [Neisseria dentiae]